MSCGVTLSKQSGGAYHGVAFDESLGGKVTSWTVGNHCGGGRRKTRRRGMKKGKRVGRRPKTIRRRRTQRRGGLIQQGGNGLVGYTFDLNDQIAGRPVVTGYEHGC